jgi:hypothetical protein
MEDLRQQLIEAGWRQGALVGPGSFGHAEACAFVVLNQTCDCLNQRSRLNRGWSFCRW